MIHQGLANAALFVAAMGLLPASLCMADVITVSYSGTIFLSQVPGISDGSVFTGSFSYDSTLQPYFQYTDQGENNTFLSGDGLTFGVDGFNFSTSPGVGSDLGEGLEGPPANQDVFGVNNQSGLDGPVSYITNYQALPLFQMGNQFVWNTGTLQNGVLPNPFNASGVLIGLIPGGYTGILVLYKTACCPIPLMQVGC